MLREQVINYIDKFLSNRGFNLTKEGDKTAQQLYYSKKENDLIIGIRFLSEIYENKYFYGFVNCNQVPLVENIVANILYKNKITAVKPKDIYNTIMTRDYDEYRLPADGILIDTEQKSAEVCNLFDRFYNEYFIPFYEKWKDLNVLYEYIKDKSIKTNPLAIKVKINDLRDNMDITRLVYITEKDTERLNKYLKAYQELKVCL